MSDNKNTYYTILIRTDNNTDNKLENLVLLETTDTETIGYIVKYNTLVTEDKKEQEIINSGFSEVIPITIQSTESSNRVMVITYTYSLCNGVPYNCGGSICGFATGIMTIEVDDPGDMTPYSGGWNTDGGGGANTGPGDPNDPTGPGTGCRGCGDIITSPVFEFEDEGGETPCDELKKLTQNPTLPNYPNMTSQDKNIRTAIINMDSEINPYSEKGYAFLSIQPNGIMEYAPFADYTPPPPSDPNHVYFSSPFMFGTLHTHPNDDVYIPMFSHDDIYSLLSTAENYISVNTSGNDLFVCVLAVEIGSSSYTYAIKIEDITKLQKLKNLHPKANGTKTKWVQYGEKLKKYYEKKANGVNGSSSQYEKTFLQFIEDQDLGVSLYEMEQINTGTPDVQENWKKLELDGNNPLKEIPCN